MGLLGNVLRGLGKVVGGAAKVVAAQATGGASDKLISAIKSRGQAKTLAAAGMTDGPRAKTMQTIALEKSLPRGTRLRAAPRPDIAQMAIKQARIRQASRRRAAQVAEALELAGVQSKRGLLDFSAMSEAWREAGQPMPWQSWIKSQPLYRLDD